MSLDYFDPMDAETFDAEECINYGEKCRGPVGYHWPGHGNKNFTRCEFHAAERLRKADEDRMKYPDTDIAPSWFDPSYAGEHWGDDY